MVDLDSQEVRSFVSNLLTKLLTLTWIFWNLRLYVVDSQIYVLNC